MTTGNTPKYGESREGKNGGGDLISAGVFQTIDHGWGGDIS